MADAEHPRAEPVLRLAAQCIYTTRGLRELESLRADPTKPLVEQRWWATGKMLFEQAQRAGTRLPILISDGAECQRLVYWGLIDALEAHGKGTAIWISHWQPLDGPRTHELVSINKGAALSEEFTRPYSPCHTPWFILSQDKTSVGVRSKRAWVVKGRPDRNDFQSELVPNRSAIWKTARPPSTWQGNDFVFFWESSPARHVVGLGRIVGVLVPQDADGLTHFAVQYLTGNLAHPVKLGDVRKDSALENASFTKSGAAGTVFPLTRRQSLHLAALTARMNPSCGAILEEFLALAPVEIEEAVAALRRGDLNVNSSLDSADLALCDTQEGRLALAIHVVRERSKRMTRRAKEAHRERTGSLRCRICSFDFEVTYGVLGKDFAEVHHAVPLSERPEEGTATSLNDLVVVCANCHRMLHRQRPWLTVESLERLLPSPSERARA